jgi:hypothetical protein
MAWYSAGVMTLGLVLACLYVIFHRSHSPWLTATIMTSWLVGVLLLFGVLIGVFPHLEPNVTLLGAITAPTLTILAGFRHANAHRRTEPSL